MKLYNIFFFLCTFFLSSCDEGDITISNIPENINEFYQFNLSFAEDTDNSDSITLSWLENSMITTFNIEIDGENNVASKKDQYTFPLLPGLFKDVIITADDVLSETIKIFSSPMAPTSWRPDFVGDIKVTESFTENGVPFNQFEWIPSIETDIATIELKKCGYISSPNECSEFSSFISIPTFDSGEYIYSESKNFGEKACYIMYSTDLTGNSRYSQIICNDLTANTMMDVTITSISINLENKINLEWTEYNQSDFYQYTLYRSENEGVDHDSRIVIADIIDASQTIFEDRNNIGIGKTWYYQIEVHNQYGRISTSNIKLGKSKP